MSATAKAKVELDHVGFDRGVQKMGQSMGHFREHVTGEFKKLVVGVVGFEAIKEAVKETIGWANELKDIADETGVSEENLAAMAMAAQRAGSNLEHVKKMLLEANKARKDGLEDANKMEKLSKLGITEQMLRTGKPLELLETAAKSQEKKGAATSNIALADLVGSKLASRLTAMRPDVGNFKQFKADEQKAGRLPAQADFDSVSEIEEQITVVLQQVRGKLMPIIAKGINWLTETFYDVSDWIELHAKGLFMFIQSINIFDYIMDTVVSTGEVLFDVFKKNLQDLVKPFITMWDMIQNTVETYIEVFKDIFHGKFQAAQNKLADLFDSNVKGGKQIGAEVVGGAKNIFNRDIEVPGRIVADVQSKNEEAVNATKDWMDKTEMQQKKAKEAREHERQEFLKRRKEQREGTNEKFEKEFKPAAPPSDNLITQGNFLGSNLNSTTDIAKEHLDIAKQQLNALQAIQGKLGYGFYGPGMFVHQEPPYKG